MEIHGIENVFVLRVLYV